MLKSHIHTTIDYWCIVSLKTGVVKGMLAPLIIGMVQMYLGSRRICTIAEIKRK